MIADASSDVAFAEGLIAAVNTVADAAGFVGNAVISTPAEVLASITLPETVTISLPPAPSPSPPPSLPPAPPPIG